MQRVLERGGGVAVGKVHELEGDALLVGGYAGVGEDHVDEAGVAGTFGEAVVTEGGGGEGGVYCCCCDLIRGRGRSEGCGLRVGGRGVGGGTVGGHCAWVDYLDIEFRYMVMDPCSMEPQTNVLRGRMKVDVVV